MLIWLKKEKHLKTKIYYHISKMSKQIIAFGNLEIETQISSSQKPNFVRTCTYW